MRIHDMDEYIVYKQWLKYYVIPSTGFIFKIFYTDNFISFYSKQNAIKCCRKMNEAFNRGYQHRVFEANLKALKEVKNETL